MCVCVCARAREWMIGCEHEYCVYGWVERCEHEYCVWGGDTSMASVYNAAALRTQV